MKLLKVILTLLTAGILLIGCSSPNENSDSKKKDSNLSIYTTVYPLQYIVEEIGGDTVDVHSVYPPGADGHMYEPTSKEMTEFAKSDAFIYIGAGMEGFADSVSNALASQSVELIEIGVHEELFKKGLYEHAGHQHDENEFILIDGLSDHYHSGDSFTLTAKSNEDTAHNHWHWFTLDSDSGDWVVVEDLHENIYEDEVSVSGQQIKAVLYDDNHETIAESEPVTIVINDHGHDHEDSEDHDHGESEEHNHDHGESEEHDHEATDDHHHGKIGDYGAEIEGLAAHYHTGDMITLTAKPVEDTGNNHWHWFILAPDAEDWEVAEDAHGDTYEAEATLSGQQIKAVLYDGDHEVVAESEPKTIIIDDHTDHDPHIWVDPLRMIAIAEIVKEELTALNPDDSELYKENFAILKDNLTELDQRFLDLLSQKENKYIIVPHSAFGYWEERYDVKQITINGLSSGDEPSQKELIEVMKAAEEYDLNTVLYEQNSDNRLSKVVQEETGAEAATIHNLEVRTEEDIKNGEDYISLMEYNLDILDKVMK
ncbi:metal ABC transporter solute-binding protein, Zn/Mn family [Oceanobacillus sp. FSL H7-0719]|uniref:metal ABC transporter solute-binding protein, Zn/Mn family n=1 Tax=Oceanobacillus sp. FSL H7-0719 TaxID=2954507 RepID=UPI00324A1D5B